ncbi:hypothetical protein [Xanthocytophaga agilis]|uniref:Uncharacterized protein n=1 Tax=Xanthocytophaga agilis TaxID=3048010 RepID=A0AAE3UDW8_9BACT|nr:hypothetical protein [Xanthocytophaga agilis]MDJ1499652.1 hypothetical protein [Xanthocytophaga agilis]
MKKTDTLLGTLIGIFGSTFIISTLAAEACTSSGPCGAGICMLMWHLVGVPLGIIAGNLIVTGWRRYIHKSS